MSTITVNSIPSYLQADGTNVIDNGNGTYDILDLSKEDKVSLNQILGSKRNSFTYMDVTVSGNQLSNPSISFTNEDVGKYLAIKKAHHNPNTADGSEIPNTTLGRIVTATVKITAVDTVNNTATISKSLNKSGALRAYKYTNNYDEIQQAINLGYYFDIETVVFDITGIICMNPYYADYYTGFTGLNIQSSLDKNIRLVDGGGVKFLKSTIEDSNENHQIFKVDHGNGDLYSDFNILPGDNGATPFWKGCDLLDFGVNNTVIMVRNLTVKNVILKDEDFDGTAGSFRTCLTGSGGGNGEPEVHKREYQVIEFENMDTRNFGGGYSAFKNPNNSELIGGTIDVRLKDVNIQRWSSDNILMRGREQIYAFDRNASETAPGSFRFMPSYEYNLYTNSYYVGAFTASNGVVTINDDLKEELNFVELSLEDRVNRGFKVALRGASGGQPYYLDNTQPVNKTTATFTGIPDGSYDYLELTNESDIDNSITATTSADGLTLTVDANADFSWHDFNVGGTSRDTRVTLNGVPYLLAGPSGSSNVVDAKTITSDTVLPLSQTYTEFGVGREYDVNSFGAYGHPAYIHPHCDMTFDNFVSDKDTIWLNSSGGKGSPGGNTVTIKNCKNLQNLQISNGSIYKHYTDVIFEDSIVSFGSVFNGGTLTMKDTVFLGSSMTFNELISMGKNTFGTITLLTQKEFISEDDTLYGKLEFLEGTYVELRRPTILEAGRVVAKDSDSLVRIYEASSTSGMMLYMNGAGDNKVEYVNCHTTAGLTATIYLDAFAPNQVKFINSKTSLILEPRSAVDLNTAANRYVENNNGVSIPVDTNNPVVEKTSISGVPSNFLPWLRHCAYALVINPSLESVVKVTGDIQRVEIESRVAEEFRFDYGDCSPFFFYQGQIKLILTEENQLDIFKFYNSFPSYPPSGRVKNCTTTNLNVKTNHRVVGEEVTFEFDSKNGRLIELHSSVERKYTNARPTARGIHKERLYDSTKEGVYWEHFIDREFKEETLTVPQIDENVYDTFGKTNTYIMPKKMDFGKYFSIGQEFHKEEPTRFEISLFLDTDEEVICDNVGRSGLEAQKTVQATSQDPNAVRSLWLFKGIDSNNKVYNFGIDNVDGILRFNWTSVPSVDGLPALRSTNNVKYKGYVIHGNTWYRGYEGPGAEKVTTAERTSILAECPDGYEVIDTDLNQKFTKVNGAWV